MGNIFYKIEYTMFITFHDSYLISDFQPSDKDAQVFHFNKGSSRVLEKAGFQFEEFLHQYFKKDGQSIDGKLYSILDNHGQSSLGLYNGMAK